MFPWDQGVLGSKRRYGWSSQSRVLGGLGPCFDHDGEETYLLSFGNCCGRGVLENVDTNGRDKGFGVSVQQEA